MNPNPYSTTGLPVIPYTLKTEIDGIVYETHVLTNTCQVITEDGITLCEVLKGLVTSKELQEAISKVTFEDTVYQYKGILLNKPDISAIDQLYSKVGMQDGEVYLVELSSAKKITTRAAVKLAEKRAASEKSYPVASPRFDMYCWSSELNKWIFFGSTEKDTLQGNIDAATTRIDTLESTVGNADSGLVKKVNDVVTAEAADAKKIAILETTVGDEHSGIIAIINSGIETVNDHGTTLRIHGVSINSLSDEYNNITKDGGTIDTKVAAHNTATNAHSDLFAAKQNKVFQKTLTVAKASFTAAAADEPGEFVGSFTIAGVDVAKAYKVDVVPVIDTTATHKAILAAGFLPMTSFEAGVLKLYALKTPTADFEVSLTFTEIQ